MTTRTATHCRVDARPRVRSAGTAGKPVVPAEPACTPLVPRGHLRGHDRGSNPIELAILLPVIVLALFSSIQISLYFLARSEALGAAQQGATAQRAFHAAAGTGKTQADRFVAQGNGWLGAQTTTVTCTNPDPGKTACGANSTGVLVTVTGRSISLIPGWGITVTQSAHGEIERTTMPPALPTAAPAPGTP